MFRFPKIANEKSRSRFLARAIRLDIILLLMLATFQSATFAQDKFFGIGRTATPAEIKAWDIDVRPDFKGLPAGSGSVVKANRYGNRNANPVTVCSVNPTKFLHR